MDGAMKKAMGLLFLCLVFQGCRNVDVADTPGYDDYMSANGIVFGETMLLSGYIGGAVAEGDTVYLLGPAPSDAVAYERMSDDSVCLPKGYPVRVVSITKNYLLIGGWMTTAVVEFMAPDSKESIRAWLDLGPGFTGHESHPMLKIKTN